MFHLAIFFFNNLYYHNAFIFSIERYYEWDERFVHASRHSLVNRTRHWVTLATLKFSNPPLVNLHVHTRAYTRVRQWRVAEVPWRRFSGDEKVQVFLPDAIDLGTAYFLSLWKRRITLNLFSSLDPISLLFIIIYSINWHLSEFYQ